MKKTLVFVMVLSAVGSVGAGLQLTVNGEATHETTLQVGGELTIGVVNDSSSLSVPLTLFMPWGQPGEWILPNIQPGGQIPGPIINSWDWEYFEMEGVGTGWMWPAGGPVIEPDPIPAGIMGEFGFRCTGQGDVSIILTNENLDPYDSLLIHQIPEPATLALLGLGMSLVRRKKGLE